MEKVKLELTEEESYTLNNILVDNCMAMVELFNVESGKPGEEQARTLLEMSVAVQQTLFIKTMQRKEEFPKTLALFLRTLLEGSVERMQSIKERMVKEGHDQAFAVAANQEIVKLVIAKITATEKEESKIII